MDKDVKILINECVCCCANCQFAVIHEKDSDGYRWNCTNSPGGSRTVWAIEVCSDYKYKDRRNLTQ